MQIASLFLIINYFIKAEYKIYAKEKMENLNYLDSPLWYLCLFPSI